MVNKTLVLIGACGNNATACGGEVCKNLNFKSYFKGVFKQLVVFNTSCFKKKPYLAVKMVYTLMKHPEYKVFLSIASQSANRLLKLFRVIGLRNDIVYCVVGGSFHKAVEAGTFSAEDYSNVKSILVQSSEMKSTLDAHGFKNVFFVPNSKVIDYYPNKEEKKDRKCHFVFLSQIREEKGCSLIIECIKKLNEHGFSETFDVSFYGKIHPSYKEYFDAEVKRLDNCNYYGILDLNQPKNYDTLAKYDVMLFPSFWAGEGFPGVFIDAFIASLPVVASDWNFNKLYIEENKTGWIIPAMDMIALKFKMIEIIQMEKSILMNMSTYLRAAANRFDSRNVITEEFLNTLIS